MASSNGKKKKGKGSSKGTKYEAIMSDMVDFDEEELYLSILGYGKNARGKTHFAGSMPGPIAYIDFNDRGTLSLRGKGVKGWRIESGEWEKLEQIYWYLKSGNHKFKSVVWDTGTGAADVALAHVMGVAGEYDTDAGKLVTRQDWGNMSKEMKYWYTKFRNLEMHKFFAFQEKSLEEDDVEDGDSLVVPMISPAVRAVACAAVDIIARFELFDKKIITGKKDKKKSEKVPTYRIRVGPDTRYQTKFRTPDGVKLPVKFIEDPSFDKVMELYQSINQI